MLPVLHSILNVRRNYCRLTTVVRPYCSTECEVLMDRPPGPLKRRTPSSVTGQQAEQHSDTTPLPAVEPKATTGRLTALVLAIGVPTLVAAAGIVGIVLWSQARPQLSELDLRLPDPQHMTAAPDTADHAEAADPTTTATGNGSAGQPQTEAGVGEPPQQPSGSPAAVTGTDSLPGLWPWFRGPDRDNVNKEKVRLATGWGAGGPPRLWSVNLGEGYAGPAVRDGRVYLLDYDQARRADTLRCMSLADGREIWTQSYAVDVKRNHGMSRTVPSVTDKYVVTLGPKCHVMCCDVDTGQVRWKMDLVSEYGTEVPPWYAGQCPLIDGDRVILAPGGSALMMAVDLASGRVIWKTPNPRGWKMTHASITPVTHGAKKMYVYPASGGVVGIAADDGKLLWENPDWRVSTANIPTPIPLGGGYMFLSGGYNAGGALLRLTGSGGNIQGTIEQRLADPMAGSRQHTYILHNNYLFGVVPSGELTCLDLQGKQRWSSGSTKRFGLNAYMIAGGMIYILTDAGELVLVKATPDSYQEMSRSKILNNTELWGPMAMAGGRLLARDSTSMVCLDVSAR